MLKNIAVFGNGIIAHRIKESFGCLLFDKEISSFGDVDSIISKCNPNIIINCFDCASSTADECELDKDKTLRVNVFSPILLAEAAFRHKIKFIHIGSACIFQYDYNKNIPITEEVSPDFFDLFYARTMIYAEQAIKPFLNKTANLSLRIRLPLDVRPHPKNILTKFIDYKRIIDLPNSVTYIPDFIEALKHLISINARGIYNVVNDDPLYYPDLMQVYKKYKKDFEFKVIKYEDLNLVRTNIVLSVKKLGDSGFGMRKISEVLEECVQKYISY